MSIFQLWNLNRFKNPISLSRSELMELSKVSSKTTYHKCMKELQQLGYLHYDPSYHPLRGSWVHLFSFNAAGDSNQSKNCPGSGLVLDRQWTGAGQAVYKLASESEAGKGFPGPLNIYKHIKHNKLFYRPTVELLENKELGKKEIVIENNDFSCGVENSVLANSAAYNLTDEADEKYSANRPKNTSDNVPDTQAKVIQFFLQSGYNESHAIKFYQYYSALGWKVAGKAPIENWRAVAHCWMLNSQNSNNNGKSTKSENRAGSLHTSSNKDYSEPL